MPCHSPTKARVIFSLTRAVPSAAMEMVSLKSVTRQLRTWAEAVASGSARIRSKSKGFTTRNTGEHRGVPGADSHGGLGWRECWCSMPEFYRHWFAIRRSGFEELLLLEGGP